MKTLQSILAATALVILAVPCTHAEEHCHAVEAHELSAPGCEHCHCCKETSCSKPEQAVQGSLDSPVSIPVRSVPLIAVFNHSVPVSLPAPRPPERLRLLQSVQLLI